jgi:hypothetical protein
MNTTGKYVRYIPVLLERIKKRIFKKKNVGYLAKAHRELKQILRAGSVERNITSRASRTACSVRIWAHANA